MQHYLGRLGLKLNVLFQSSERFVEDDSKLSSVNTMDGEEDLLEDTVFPLASLPAGHFASFGWLNGSITSDNEQAD